LVFLIRLNTVAETCFCRTGLNRFKPRFKPPLAETCQPCFRGWRRQKSTGRHTRATVLTLDNKG